MEYKELALKSSESSEKSSENNLPFPVTKIRKSPKRKHKSKFKTSISRSSKHAPSLVPNNNTSKSIDADCTLQIQGNAIMAVKPRVVPSSKHKESTRKLMELIQAVQAKLASKKEESTEMKEEFDPDGYLLLMMKRQRNILTDPIVILSLKNIGDQVFQELTLLAKDDVIMVPDDVDDCSVYRRLTRRCVCLNRKEFNDFVIHFNEDNRRFASSLGEIIRNLRILKRFLYMGKNYTKNALIFINEGLTFSQHKNRLELVQGCCFADMCNVFEGDSLIKTCVYNTCDNHIFGDTVTQFLASKFICSLAECEEGRRYLNYSSKILKDTEKTLIKKGVRLDYQTVELLNTSAYLLNKALKERLNSTYCTKQFEEGTSREIIHYLAQYRDRMTTDELFIHLNLLHNFTCKETERWNVIRELPKLLAVFMQMLKDYDDSEMNILFINILNNIITRDMMQTPANVIKESISMQTSEIEKKPYRCAKVIQNVSGNPQQYIVEMLSRDTMNNANSRYDPSNIILVPIEDKKNT